MSQQLGVTSIAVPAGVEVATGLFLIIRPSLCVRLLFGAELSDPGQALARLTGFALLSLALACWPRRGTERGPVSALRALLLFSVLTTAYLAYLGIGGALIGILL